MRQELKELLHANEEYAAGFNDKGDLALLPARQLAVLTCMDARVDPYKIMGLKEGDAHIIRNAGGRASNDAIRSLVVSHRLAGTQVWLVMHHTDCAMGKVTDRQMGELLEESLDPVNDSRAYLRSISNGSLVGYEVEWLTFQDPIQAVVEDVQCIREHPLVPRSVTIYGYIFDVKTGRLIEVPEAHRPA